MGYLSNSAPKKLNSIRSKIQAFMDQKITTDLCYRYVDTNALSMAPQGTVLPFRPDDPDRKMDMQLYQDFISVQSPFSSAYEWIRLILVLTRLTMIHCASFVLTHARISLTKLSLHKTTPNIVRHRGYGHFSFALALDSVADGIFQDEAIYTSMCECNFDSVGAYVTYSAHAHARVTVPSLHQD